jgi:hypothetical protein
MHPHEPDPMPPELGALIGHAAHALNRHTSHDGLCAECECAWPRLFRDEIGKASGTQVKPGRGIPSTTAQHRKRRCSDVVALAEAILERAG